MNKEVSVGATTYEQIKHDIIFGVLAPGAKLKLNELKTRYAASISTLRETLNNLAGEGFVRAEEQRGFFVAPVSREDFREIADLRILLEQTALEASIANGDTDWEGKILAAHHKLKLMEARMSAGDSTVRESWKRYDWEFHQALISACNSKNLLTIHSIIFDKYLRYQMLVLTDRGADAAVEHQMLLDAVMSRDPKSAKAILEQHVEAGLKHAEVVLENVISHGVR